MMFDDTYDHEVWNDTDGLRTILFMDVFRPMRFPASMVNSLIINSIKHTGTSRMPRKHPFWLVGTLHQLLSASTLQMAKILYFRSN